MQVPIIFYIPGFIAIFILILLPDAEPEKSEHLYYYSIIMFTPSYKNKVNN